MSQGNENISIPRGERCLSAVLKVCHYAGSAVIVAMMLLTVVHAIGRYGFNLPVPGIVELSSYMLVTSSFLLSGYTMIIKRHISIGLIVDRFSERTQTIIDSFTYIICLAVAIAGFWYTLTRGIFMMQVGKQASGILHIPYFPFIYIMAVGWAMFALATVTHLVHLLIKAVKR